MIWTDVAAVVVDLLAEDARTDAAAVRAQLAAAGEGWPIDSLLLVEVLQRVEERFGVTVPETVAAARTFTSVVAFSQMVAEAAAASAGAAGGGAA
jgi:acyl carrier protein